MHLLLLLLFLSLQQAEPFAPFSSSPRVCCRRPTRHAGVASLSSSSRLSLSSRQGPDYWSYDQQENDVGSMDKRPYREPVVGGSEAERQLQNIRPAVDDDYDYFDYDDDNEEEEEEEYAPLDHPRQRNNLSRRPTRRQEELDYYSEEDNVEQDEPIGNFWSNPESSLDPAPLSPPVRPRRRTNDAPLRKRKATTFRSGIPEPPPPVTDFYNRLFWYGFDPAESTSSSPADKTMFGGTKGKFNGLAFLKDGGITMPDDQRRRKPRRTSPRNEEDYEEEYSLNGNSNYYDDDEEEGEDYRPYEKEEDNNKEMNYGFGRNVTPPYDSLSTQSSPGTPVRARQSRRRQPRQGRGEDESDRRSRRHRHGSTSPVSSWFDAEVEYDDNDDENYFDDRSSQRQRADPMNEKPLNPFDVFLGRNRENLNRQAEAYNQQMGLQQQQQDQEGRPSRRGRRKRPGYAYRYDADEDDYSDVPPVAELETVLEDDENEDELIDVTASRRRDRNGGDERIQTSKDQTSSATTTPPKRVLTWEERSMAIERVPPVNVPAWGPSGDLGMDARSHAISEATQDILAAQRRVEAKEANVEQRREDLSILKVDVELERKQLLRQRLETRRMQQRLLEIDEDVEEAARALRFAQLQLKTARDELAAVETRHWGVLSFYNPTQVENGIEEAFREFEESEPAVQRFREKQMEEERRKEEGGMKAQGADADQAESYDGSI